MSILLENRKVRAQYSVIDTYEAGVVLLGGEVKSIRMGRASLAESFVRITDGEAFMVNMYVHPYGFSDNRGYDPRQARKLLLHKREIVQLQSNVLGKGVTIVPLKIYEKRNKFKVQIGLVRGKTQVDRRKELRERDLNREVERALRGKK